MTSSNTRSKWTLHEDKKWIELFAHFVEDVFGISDAEFQQIHQSDQVPIDLSKKAWDNLAATLTKIKQQKRYVFLNLKNISAMLNLASCSTIGFNESRVRMIGNFQLPTMLLFVNISFWPLKQTFIHYTDF
jgi:hypothetical protein